MTECPVVIHGRPCRSGQRIVKGECLFHYKQRVHGRVLTEWKPRQRMGSSAERDAAGRKFCPRCKTWRPTADFTPRAKAIDGLQNYCSPCASDYMSLRRYGLTRARVNEMLRAQGGCAICKAAKPSSSDYRRGWHVDHDHECCPDGRSTCGRCVRGILCGRCNNLIGQAGDDPSVLAAAIDYLNARLCETTHEEPK